VKKQGKRKAPAPAEPPSKGMSIDAILGQLASMKDNAKSFIDGNDPEADAIWAADIATCEAATDILTALQDEGINDHEQVRDLIHDYNALAEQYRAMHKKYEEPAKPERFGLVAGHYATYICPKCRNQVRPSHSYCWNCGKRLGGGR